MVQSHRMHSARGKFSPAELLWRAPRRQLPAPGPLQCPQQTSPMDCGTPSHRGQNPPQAQTKAVSYAKVVFPLGRPRTPGAGAPEEPSTCLAFLLHLSPLEAGHPAHNLHEKDGGRTFPDTLSRAGSPCYGEEGRPA